MHSTTPERLSNQRYQLPGNQEDVYGGVKNRRISWKSIEREVRLPVHSPLCIAKQLPEHTPQWETGGLLSEENQTQEALDSELPGILGQEVRRLTKNKGIQWKSCIPTLNSPTVFSCLTPKMESILYP